MSLNSFIVLLCRKRCECFLYLIPLKEIQNSSSELIASWAVIVGWAEAESVCFVSPGDFHLICWYPILHDLHPNFN